jgi:hypothetical protein
MSRQRSGYPAGIVLGLLMALCATGVFQAITTIVDPDTGYLLTADVVSDPQNPSVQGVRLRQQEPGGTSTYETIPSSYDPIIDTMPVVAKGSGTDLVVVWSRHDGHDFELAMSRRGTAGWEPLELLTDNSQSDSEARALADVDDLVHVLWWANGLGGPIVLESFDTRTGIPRGPAYRPFESQGGGNNNPKSTLFDETGGLDDPGIPTKSGFNKASANPCASNPSAVPDHGVIRSCGRAAAWQVTSCRLVVGLQDVSTGTWSQTIVDMSDLGTTSPQGLAQVIADQRCN